jgi:hypothetical protein
LKGAIQHKVNGLLSAGNERSPTMAHGPHRYRLLDAIYLLKQVAPQKGVWLSFIDPIYEKVGDTKSAEAMHQWLCDLHEQVGSGGMLDALGIDGETAVWFAVEGDRQSDPWFCLNMPSELHKEFYRRHSNIAP